MICSTTEVLCDPKEKCSGQQMAENLIEGGEQKVDRFELYGSCLNLVYVCICSSYMAYDDGICIYIIYNDIL